MLLVIPTIRPQENLFEDWMFIFFCIGLGFFSFYQAFYFSKIRNVFRAFRSDVFLRQLMREENITPRAHFFLAVLHAALMGLLVVITLAHSFSFQYPTWIMFGITWAGVMLMYGLKWTLIQITQWIIDGDFTLAEYSYRTFALNRLLAIILFPIVIFTCLTDTHQLDSVLVFTWSMVLIALIWRVLKGSWVAFQARVPLFYIFFYICTLEILPLILAYRFFLNSINAQ